MAGGPAFFGVLFSLFLFGVSLFCLFFCGRPFGFIGSAFRSCPCARRRWFIWEKNAPPQRGSRHWYLRRFSLGVPVVPKPFVPSCPAGHIGLMPGHTTSLRAPGPGCGSMPSSISLRLSARARRWASVCSGSWRRVPPPGGRPRRGTGRAASASRATPSTAAVAILLYSHTSLSSTSLPHSTIVRCPLATCSIYCSWRARHAECLYCREHRGPKHPSPTSHSRLLLSSSPRAHACFRVCVRRRTARRWAAPWSSSIPHPILLHSRVSARTRALASLVPSELPVPTRSPCHLYHLRFAAACSCSSCPARHARRSCCGRMRDRRPWSSAACCPCGGLLCPLATCALLLPPPTLSRALGMGGGGLFPRPSVSSRSSPRLRLRRSILARGCSRS